MIETYYPEQITPMPVGSLVQERCQSLSKPAFLEHVLNRRNRATSPKYVRTFRADRNTVNVRVKGTGGSSSPVGKQQEQRELTCDVSHPLRRDHFRRETDSAGLVTNY